MLQCIHKEQRERKLVIMNMSKFEIWLENSEYGYYGKESSDGKYVEYLINKWNGVTVRCYYGERMAQVGQADGTWIPYSYTKLIKELEA